MSALNIALSPKTIRDEKHDAIRKNVRALTDLGSQIEATIAKLIGFDQDLQTINSPLLYTMRDLAITKETNPELAFRYSQIESSLSYFRGCMLRHLTQRRDYEAQLSLFVDTLNETNKMMHDVCSHGLYWLVNIMHGNYIVPKAVYKESTTAMFETPPLFSIPTMKIPESPKPTVKSDPIPISPNFKPPKFGLKDREMLKPREITLSDEPPKRKHGDKDGGSGSSEEYGSLH